MSRVFGVFGAGATANRFASAWKGVSLSHWQTKDLALADGFISWSGPADRQSRVWESAAHAVAIEGTLYERNDANSELGPESKAWPDARWVAEAYRKWGWAETLRRVDGDFVIALADKGRKTAYLARDRMGVRPLYYRAQGAQLAFASHLKSLTQTVAEGASPRRAFVARFLGCHYRVIDNEPELSPIEGVMQLEAGHWIEWSVAGSGRPQRYWRLEAPLFAGPLDSPKWERELADEYRRLFLDAVDRRVSRTGRSAFTLSGGMDSSSVLAAAVRGTGRKQVAISSVYRDRTYDESDDIATILSDCTERWIAVPIDETGIFESVTKIVAAQGEPLATATWLSHYKVCEEASAQGFGTLYGGLGGDELNAGEYEYFFPFFADIKASGDEARLHREIEFWAKYHDHPIYKKNLEVAEAALRSKVDLSVPGRCRTDRDRMLHYAAAVNREYFDLERFQPRMESLGPSYLANRCYQDLFWETTPCCLRAQDRNGGAFGIETVMPFLDRHLVEFMFRVPSQLKIRDGVTKSLLRIAMEGILPESTRTRIKKTGWNAPAHLWFSGEGMKALHDLLLSARARNRGVYNPKEVERLMQEHEAIVASGAARENHMMFLWQALNLEVWLRDLEGSS